MDYFFYHSPDAAPAGTFRGKRIWLPAVPEAGEMIAYILQRRPGNTVWVEETLAGKVNSAYREKFQVFPAPSAAHFRRKKILLYAQSDTLANSLCIVGEGLKEHELHYMVPRMARERADTYFEHYGIKYSPYSYGQLKQFRPDLLLLLNDWSKEPQRILAHSRWLGIPVICLQESVVDFGDRFRRMQWADYVMVQGAQTVLDLQRENYFVTGNPRYEEIQPVQQHGNEALINCNFTYGIFEDQRYAWLDDLDAALGEAGIPYAISQHPRDKGDLSRYKKVLPSSSAAVHDQLRQAAFLITRFSSLIHEALVMGIPVIYYNPHGENMQYDFGFNDSFIQLATNRDELRRAVGRLQHYTPVPGALDTYLASHCLVRSSLPVQNIAWLAGHATLQPGRFRAGDAAKAMFYHPRIKAGLSALRKIVKG